MFKFFSKSSVDPPNILKFYENHSPSEDFDEIVYLKTHPEVKNFYKPFCLKHDISERKRLYYHFYFYGPKMPHSYHKFCCENDLTCAHLNFRHFKVGYCTTAFNRLDSIKHTLPINLRQKKSDEQLVLVDYSSTDGLKEYIKENFIQYINSGDLKFFIINKESFYHCPIAKNIAHYYCDAEYVVNLDSDNVLTGMRKAINKQVLKSPNNFLLHMAVLEKPFSQNMQKQKKGYSGTFGRICMHKNDFIKLSGYNETFLPMAYQDSDLIHRAKQSGMKYVYQPVKVKPAENSKFITFSSDTDFYSWSDCRDINEFISQHHLSKKRFVAQNIPKSLTAILNFKDSLVIDYKNIADFDPKFSITRQINPGLKGNVFDNFLNYDFNSYFDKLDFYIKNILPDILFQKPDIIESIKANLTEGISTYASQSSAAYQSLIPKPDQIFSRVDFDDAPEAWVSSSISSALLLKQHTSGSSTGKPFGYFNHSKYFSTVQDLAEFSIIRKEFRLPIDNLKVLSLIQWPGAPKFDNFSLETKNLNKGNMFNSFGANSFETSFINFSDYQNDPSKWHEKLFDFLDGKYFDVVLSSGSIINLLTNYIKEFNFNKNFCHLLSHSTDPVKPEDFTFLKQNGNINHFCDHMRCWDGGATFFTCEHGTYHLHEGVANVRQGSNNELISTCFTNVASPFVNYHNGDYCKLSNDYKLCSCGRYYRPFEFLESRPFAIKGVDSINSLRNKIETLDFARLITQVQFHRGSVMVHSKILLSEAQRIEVQNKISNFEVLFRT